MLLYPSIKYRFVSSSSVAILMAIQALARIRDLTGNFAAHSLS